MRSQKCIYESGDNGVNGDTLLMILNARHRCLRWHTSQPIIVRNFGRFWGGMLVCFKAAH